ncbi:MAG: hypothetical protein LC708_02040, partial [Actinobacteria bacterium]|nr:hypothetical protein [Actinomycetota bacterium]
MVVGHAGPTFPTLGGNVGVSLAYNSQAPTAGLVGSYYDDPTASRVFGTKTPVLVRNDPGVAFHWGTDTAPGPGLGTDNYLARWDGAITVPTTGSYLFYIGGTTDGVRLFINGTMVLERWSESTGSTNDTISGSAITLSAGAAVPIKVEYFEGTGSAGLTLATYGPLGAGGAAKAVIVPPSWLRGDPGSLPVGWTLSATPGMAYVGARSFEHGATLTDASGALHTYASTGSGYVPPPGEDGVLTRNPDNTLTLTAEDGASYVFDILGQLTWATARGDQANATSPVYEFSTVAGRPRRLQRLRDPVGNRALTLRYGNFDATALPCPSVPSGFSAVPDNQLCQLDYWDGTQSVLRYNAAGQLVRIEDPGGAVSDFAYDANTRLAKVRDPLAADAIAATAITATPDDDRSRTLIAYDSAGRAASLSLAVPNAGAVGELPRPAHTYEYPSGTETRVRVAGLSGATDEPNGYNRKVTFDLGGRTLDDTDATARTTTSVWDGGDRLVSRTDAAGRRSTTIYDADAPRAQLTGRVSDTYGPAPATCFGAGGIPNGSCAATPPPHTHTDYDTTAAVPATGMAMTAWTNNAYQGAPALQTQAAPDAAGVLVSGDPVGLPAGAWSARYSGEITLASTGTFGFGLTTSGGAGRLFVDDVKVADSSIGAGTGTVANTFAGRHRVRVDFSASAPGPTLGLTWTPPGGASQALGAANLAPRFANPTTTTTDDNAGVPARVTTSVYESMAWGSVKQDIVDPAGLNLVTTTAYESSGLRRPVSVTLPAGDVANAATATATAYYANADPAPAVCGRAAGPNQGGRPHTTATPSPDGTGGGRRVTEVVYDAAGRVVASHVGTEDWTCTAYDGRGRIISNAVPAFAGEPAHNFGYAYAVAANPLRSSVAEDTDVMATTVDLLGRAVSYTDGWNKTTTSTYDQAGRPTDTSGPAGSLHVSYDPAGRTKTQSLDGALMATPAYDSAGELATVSYATALNGGNGTSLSAVTRSPSGQTTGLTWTGPGGALATDALSRAQSGKVVDETIDGTDANPAGANFAYDGAGRLTHAVVGGHSLDYAFEATGGCGLQTNAGSNTNRTKVSDSALGAPLTYCYNQADRLTSSSDAAVGTPAYDAHANTTTLGTQTLIYDGADRHMETKVNGTTLVRYARDATGRITSRTEGTTITHYGFSGPGDSPSFTMDAANNLTERSIGLVGGVLVTKRGVGDVWSYPNVHGDVMATADNTGIKQGATKSYDPFG